MSKENLQHRKAREIIKEMAESIDFVPLGTNLRMQPVHVVPMSTKKGRRTASWFLSSKNAITANSSNKTIRYICFTPNQQPWNSFTYTARHP